MAQLLALGGHIEQSVFNLEKIRGDIAASSDAQLRAAARAARMLASLEHGIVLGLPRDEVGVLKYESFNALVGLRIDALDMIDKQVDDRVTELENLKTSQVISNQPDTEPQRARGSSVSLCFHQELISVLSDKMMKLESELRTGFDRMELLMKDQASELMESIRSVHKQACATQRGIR